MPHAECEIDTRIGIDVAQRDRARQVRTGQRPVDLGDLDRALGTPPDAVESQGHVRRIAELRFVGGVIRQRSEARTARAHVDVETERIGARPKIHAAVRNTTIEERVAFAPHVEQTADVEPTCLDVPRRCPPNPPAVRIDRPACGSTSVSWRSSPRMPATYQAVTGELTLNPAGPTRLAVRTASRRRPGYVAAIMSACSRTPWPRSRSNPSVAATARRRRVPRPIRATMPWRTAADSIRSRTACSSMGLSNTAARLATSAAAIAPPSHHRCPRVRNVTIDAGCHSRIARRQAGVESDGVDQVRFDRAITMISGAWQAC